MKSNNVVVEKVKVTKSEETAETKVAETSILDSLNKTLEAFIEKLKVMTGNAEPVKKAETELPVVTEAKSADMPDDSDEDGDECEKCSHCGGTGKMKKEKKTEAEPVKTEEAKVEAVKVETAPIVAKIEEKKVEAVKKEETAPVLPQTELTAETWQNSFGFKPVQTSKAMTEWQKACIEVFDNDAFNTK